MQKLSRPGYACIPPAGAASSQAASDTPCWHSGSGRCWGASGPKFHWSLPCMKSTRGQVIDETNVQLINLSSLFSSLLWFTELYPGLVRFLVNDAGCHTNAQFPQYQTDALLMVPVAADSCKTISTCCRGKCTPTTCFFCFCFPDLLPL